MATQLSFHNTKFNVVNHNNQIWLSSKEIARALEMSKDDGVSQIYHRNSDEFTADMTQTLNLSVSGGTSGRLSRKVRIFSLRGAHLIAMFARTPVAKEFRRWVLDILDREVKQQPSVRQISPAVDMLNIDLLIQIRDGNVKDIRQIGPDMFVGKVDQILSGLRNSGWIVIKRELLAEKLATW
ncbi:hypothetical protein H5518_000023 [Salmonella enterica]|nr:hypothetical protein [Salmonella enterica]ECD6767524.1 hypothetical protein [Salmonella enterica subsp. enterica serovar Newport]EIG0949835.1 hypothetical protein [Salmonella enterica subsp. enterica serovar Muenchen]PVK28877.1 hypothetical protein C4832_23475 [Salmonella enterica subsp. enterica serovar Give]EBC4166709.1 hypothetical protein [Salmonella enterica]